MIELVPLDSLALTLHHAPGVQALLLGSGISRAAGVPTGWEITVDLIRRLGSVQGVEEQADWADWYRALYSKEPDYSEILDALASTPAERRAVIHQYIEGDDASSRKPTKAHHAIARLVASGAIRLIITTNFDRLLESALRDAGIEPTVISSDDALKGATPLVHSRCTVIKLHGDYLDNRIKNTADELECYSSSIDGLLDRVLDEYGLIVVGWSGDWDTALRNAILRAANRRYPFYWAVRGALSALGADLLTHRLGKTISIADADSFFSQVLAKVEALEAMNRAHPISVALTVAEGRRICREDRFAAEWSDLLAREIERFRAFVTGPDYPTTITNNDQITDLVNKIVARSETLRRLFLVGVRWGTDEAFSIALRALAALDFSSMSQGGLVWLISLRQLAASLCFHCSVGAALLRGDYERTTRLMHLQLSSHNGKRPAAVDVLPLAALDQIEWKVLKGYERHHTPHSDFFSPLFVAEASDIVVGQGDAEQAWDDAEFTIAMEFAYRRLQRSKENGVWLWMPPGRFIWRRESGYGERAERMANLTADSPELKAGLFGGTPAGVSETLEAAIDFIKQVAGRWH